MNIHESIEIRASPHKVWALIGDVESLPVWLPGIEAVRMEGDVRHITMAGGVEAGERISSRDDAARHYEYEYVFGPAPVKSYTARLSVREKGDGSEVVWVGDVVATTPDMDAPLADGLKEAYLGGLEGMRRVIEAS